MSERRVLVKVFAGQYQAGSKKDRSRLLDEFVAASGYSRSYASWLLRWHGKQVRLGLRVVVVGDATTCWRRRRRRVYGEAVRNALRWLWEVMDYVCGKRLVAGLPAVIEALERHGAGRWDATLRSQLLSLSAATADRLLREERARHSLRSRSRTKPGTLLRHQIPVRTFAQWDEQQPGFVELDLVGHDGGDPRGEYIQTLDLTDVATGWIELGAVPTRAQRWVFEELQKLRRWLPFPLRGIDSDNGGEFINHHLVTYCDQEGITFTRSRPYRKNDNCFVEQKNWSVVRRFIGYERYEGAAALDNIRQLQTLVRLYVNFFMPSMKLVEKSRHGSQITKRYDTAKTPFERVLASPVVEAEAKAELRGQFSRLNPAELMARIRKLQHQLARRSTRSADLHPPTSTAKPGIPRSLTPPAKPAALRAPAKPPSSKPTVGVDFS